MLEVTLHGSCVNLLRQVNFIPGEEAERWTNQAHASPSRASSGVSEVSIIRVSQCEKVKGERDSG